VLFHDTEGKGGGSTANSSWALALLTQKVGSSTSMITTGSSADVKTFDQFDVALQSISLRAETRAAQLAL
jgi:hypothetical protein